jgi:hypothetical protein
MRVVTFPKPYHNSSPSRRVYFTHKANGIIALRNVRLINTNNIDSNNTGEDLLAETAQGGN